MKGAFIFIVGAAVGSVASYFILKKKFQKEADEQIEAVKEKMSELQNDNDILRDVRHKATENYHKSFDPIAKSAEGNNDMDYSSITKKYNPAAKKVNTDIVNVNEHEYFDYINNKGFNEKVFTFYQGDDSLVDEDSGMLVVDAEKYIGANGVDAMSKVTVEEVYFVDEANAVINCVTVSEDSYYGSEEPEE